MKKVLVRGPALSRSGYGEHTRFVLRALREYGDEFDTYLINTPWGGTSWMYEDNKEREWIDSLLLKTIDAGTTLQADFSLQVTVPNEWVRICHKNIGVTAGIETDRVSDAWVRGTHMVDKIIVPSEHSKNGFLGAQTSVKDPLSGAARDITVDTPIDVVSFPHKPVAPVNLSRLEESINTEFNFLSVAQMSPRKNLETSLVAFLEEFHNEDNVGYVLKVNIRNNSIVDLDNTRVALGSLLQNFPERKCKVYLTHGNFTEQEMSGLYSSDKIDCYLTASHGEGFALPVFEAASHALPIVAPNWGGYVDYTTFKPTTRSKNSKSHLVGVDYKVSPVQDEAVWSGVIEKSSNWCFTDVADLKVKMRSVYTDTKKYNSQAKKLQKHILNNFSEEGQYKLMIDSIKEVL